TGARYRLESVDNAVERAGAAAATLLCAPLPDRPVPWFWSDQGDQKLQIVGLMGGHTSVLVSEDPDKPRRRVSLYFADDALIAAECLNAPGDLRALCMAFGCCRSPRPDDLASARAT